jgi:hypothetical protein
MTRDEFAAELDHLVAEAREDSVSIEGGYNVRSPRSAAPDYTVEISEIVNRAPEWA